MINIPEEKLLIVKMDDIGMSLASNLAARNLLEKGIGTNASLMIPGAWAYDFAKWCHDNPGYDIGLHLTHTSEWDTYRWRPLSARDKAPGLFDSEGFMHKNLNTEEAIALKSEIEYESELQIAQAMDWGLKPVYIDSHMMIEFRSQNGLTSYLGLGGKYKLIPYLPGSLLKLGGMYEAVKKSGFKIIDNELHLTNVDDYQEKKAKIFEELKSIKPGLNLVNIHPVVDLPEIRAIVPFWKNRVNEYRIFMEDETRKLMDELAIKLVSIKYPM